MGNRSSSVHLRLLRKVPIKQVNNFRSWAYWSRINRLPCFRKTQLTDEDFRTALIFLQMGNFTDDDGSVRIYFADEIQYAGGTLEQCRASITAYVTLVINILIAEDKKLLLEDKKLLLDSLKSLVGNKTWNLQGQDPQVFRFIHELAVSKLKDIALRGEATLFPKIRGCFSNVYLPPKSKHRLDDNQVLPFKLLKVRFDVLFKLKKKQPSFYNFCSCILFSCMGVNNSICWCHDRDHWLAMLPAFRPMTSKLWSFSNI